MRAMVSDTIERIRAHLKLPGVTKKGLAEDAGLHPNTLQGIEDEAWNPTAETLMKLEAQLPSPHIEEAPAAPARAA